MPCLNETQSLTADLEKGCRTKGPQVKHEYKQDLDDWDLSRALAILSHFDAVLKTETFSSRETQARLRDWLGAPAFEAKFGAARHNARHHSTPIPPPIEALLAAQSRLDMALYSSAPFL